jgi:hypothetical protein
MTRLAGRWKRPPIAPSACRPPPPAVGGHPTAPCGIAPAVSRIAWSLAAFMCLPLPPQRCRCIYISPASLPRTTTHSLFHFSLFPSHGAQCTASPFFFFFFLKMPRYPDMLLFQYGAISTFLASPPSATASMTGYLDD